MSTITTQSPQDFFYEHAGYSYDPAHQTEQEGRKACAESLARAEQWGRNNGVRFHWSHETWGEDRSGIDHDGPMWCCAAYLGDEVVGCLGNIDLGATGEPQTTPYGRVCEAEIVYGEVMPNQGAR